MPHSITLGLLIFMIFAGCVAPAPAANIEATVQVAVIQTIVAMPTEASSEMPTPAATDQGLTFDEKLASLCWVAFSPTHYDPTKGIFPSEDDLRLDLRALHGAGFRGLVTYGSESPLREIPRLAREEGFQGVIMGVWSPASADELSSAKAAVAYVDGYNVGNEGLSFGRYNLDTLKVAMEDLRNATGKPIATTEVIDSYFGNAQIRELGDWTFANAHPYWNGVKDPQRAVEWTQQKYNDLVGLYTGGHRTVVFKEVGLPTAGDAAVSEEGQAKYYGALRGAGVTYVRFEAFDQPWKNDQPVEPYWGLFHSDRSSKPAANLACKALALYLPQLAQR
jgi:exo-beta-1,3-glucanase (GH17 family)